jgi:hypothetical protein
LHNDISTSQRFASSDSTSGFFINAAATSDEIYINSERLIQA